MPPLAVPTHQRDIILFLIKLSYLKFTSEWREGNVEFFKVNQLPDK